MFKLYFTYYGKDLVLEDVWGFYFSPAGRNFSVKRMKSGKLITEVYYTSAIENFMLSFAEVKK